MLHTLPATVVPQDDKRSSLAQSSGLLLADTDLDKNDIKRDCTISSVALSHEVAVMFKLCSLYVVAYLTLF
jgi:hypothetical protein